MTILYIQQENKKFIWDFCAIAEIGGRDLMYQQGTGWRVKYFEDSAKIAVHPDNVLIGSVEMLQRYFARACKPGKYPRPLDIIDCGKGLLKRQFEILSYDDFFAQYSEKSWLFPLFIKPYNVLKAFDGTVVKNDLDAYLVLNQGGKRYDGEILVTKVLDILSEWRCFVYQGEILGLRNYMGDSMTFPNSDFIKSAVQQMNIKWNKPAYVLDFAVLNNHPAVYKPQDTILLEPNDAWAIGSYGLDPTDYVKFCKKGFQSITNG